MTKHLGAAVLLFASMAQAGSVLHFQNGSVDAKAVASKVKITFANTAEDFVLQFNESITEADKAELAAKGIRVFRYVPDDALIVRATAAQLSAYAQNGKINTFIPFKGGMKLGADLPAMSVFSAGKTLPVSILTLSPEDAKEVAAFLQAHDSNYRQLDLHGTLIHARVSQTFLPELSRMRGVEFVQELPKFETLHVKLDAETLADDEIKPAGDYSDISGYETGTKVMNMDAIWALGYTGRGQIVGMADTGLDSGDASTIHVDFKGGVRSGYSYGVGAKSWDDPMGHGTHVAGSILSRGTASGGRLRGAAYEASIVAQGMWSPMIDNLTVPPKLDQMFKSAYSDGARVHTNSWGAARAFGVYDAMAAQVDQFMWDNPDMLILFAAGNSGVDMDKDGRIDPNSVGSPGTAKNTLTVGASENLLSIGGIQKKISELRAAKDVWPAEPIWSSKISDNVDGVAMFSSRGPTVDGRLKPEIVAPGTNILSNRSQVKGAEALWGEYNGDYVYSGGTSMSTPLTAGAAAVTREVLIKKFKIANPSAALVKAVLLHTATDMFPGQYGTGAGQELKTQRPNSDEGYGRVDMSKLAKLTNETGMVEAAVGQDEVYTTTVEVKNRKLLVNLVYTDAPGSPSAKAALVNNIDLIVNAKRGARTVRVSGKLDSINNNEIVELKNVTNGTYEITVRGTKVPMGKNGKQPFALVYTAL